MQKLYPHSRLCRSDSSENCLYTLGTCLAVDTPIPPAGVWPRGSWIDHCFRGAAAGGVEGEPASACTQVRCNPPPLPLAPLLLSYTKPPSRVAHTQNGSRLRCLTQLPGGVLSPRIFPGVLRHGMRTQRAAGHLDGATAERSCKVDNPGFRNNGRACHTHAHYISTLVCCTVVAADNRPDMYKGSFYANPCHDAPTDDSTLMKDHPSYCR